MVITAIMGMCRFIGTEDAPGPRAAEHLLQAGAGIGMFDDRVVLSGGGTCGQGATVVSETALGRKARSTTPGSTVLGRGSGWCSRKSGWCGMA